MTHRTVVGLLLALAALGPLSGCTALPTSDPLDGTQWVLTGIDGAAPLAGQPITLAFEDGQAYGSSGCNSYGGTYDLRGGSLTIGELMATEMACLEPGLMEQEAAYLSRLAAATSYSLADGRLDLTAGDGQSLSFATQP